MEWDNRRSILWFARSTLRIPSRMRPTRWRNQLCREWSRSEKGYICRTPCCALVGMNRPNQRSSTIQQSQTVQTSQIGRRTRKRTKTRSTKENRYTRITSTKVVVTANATTCCNKTILAPVQFSWKHQTARWGILFSTHRLETSCMFWGWGFYAIQHVVHHLSDSSKSAQSVMKRSPWAYHGM